MNCVSCPMHPRAFEAERRAAVLVAGLAMVAMCSGCAVLGEANRDVRLMPEGSRKGEPVSQVELQQDLQRFTSDFMSQLGEAGDRLYHETEPREREMAMRRVLIYASNALDIATGPYPELNLVDMIVFISLSRFAYEQHWQPKVFGERGKPLGEALSEAERQIWAMSNKILSDPQQAQFRELIGDWQKAHPDRYTVEGVRFQQFASRVSEVSADRAARARGVFGHLKAATQSADQAVLIAERAMFIAQRMPFLIRAHARLAMSESIDDSLERLHGMDQLLEQIPAAKPMLKDLLAISNNAASAARETRMLVESSEPLLARLTGNPDLDRAHGDERVGVSGTDKDVPRDALSLRDALLRVDSISQRALTLVREVRAGVPAHPEETMKLVEQRVDDMARRIAIYALLVGLGWAVAFWGGYYVVKRVKHR